MASFRKFFYKKPPDGLLEISERLFVFDCCFAIDILEEDEYKIYMKGIAHQLRNHFPDSLFMVFNFRGETQNQISSILSTYDMIVMDYPLHYDGCPMLRVEMIDHFLRSSESWLSLGQENILLMLCDRGGWRVLSFMLAALLIYKKQYTGEKKILDMIYKQAPCELVQLLSPLNSLPSQLRYLQYVSRRNVGSEWPPLDRAVTLDCVILRNLPNFDGKGGCRPIFRIYGQDPFIASDRTPKILFSTPKTGKFVRQYKQADFELVKIDIHCHIQGDVLLECINLDEDLEKESLMFQVMFNTAFIRSNILVLNRDEIDLKWTAKDLFPTEFVVEVLFSDMSASSTFSPVDLTCGEEEEGLPMEAFVKVQEMFNSLDWSHLKEVIDGFSPRKEEKSSYMKDINDNNPQEIQGITKMDTSPRQNLQKRCVSLLCCSGLIDSEKDPYSSRSSPKSYCNSPSSSSSRYHSASSDLDISSNGSPCLSLPTSPASFFPGSSGTSAISPPDSPPPPLPLSPKLSVTSDGDSSTLFLPPPSSSQEIISKSTFTNYISELLNQVLHLKTSPSTPLLSPEASYVGDQTIMMPHPPPGPPSPMLSSSSTPPPTQPPIPSHPSPPSPPSLLFPPLQLPPSLPPLPPPIPTLPPMSSTLSSLSLSPPPSPLPFPPISSPPLLSLLPPPTASLQPISSPSLPFSSPSATPSPPQISSSPLPLPSLMLSTPLLHPPSVLSPSCPPVPLSLQIASSPSPPPSLSPLRCTLSPPVSPPSSPFPSPPPPPMLSSPILSPPLSSPQPVHLPPPIISSSILSLPIFSSSSTSPSQPILSLPLPSPPPPTLPILSPPLPSPPPPTPPSLSPWILSSPPSPLILSTPLPSPSPPPPPPPPSPPPILSPSLPSPCALKTIPNNVPEEITLLPPLETNSSIKKFPSSPPTPTHSGVPSSANFPSPPSEQSHTTKKLSCSTTHISPPNPPLPPPINTGMLKERTSATPSITRGGKSSISSNIPGPPSLNMKGKGLLRSASPCSNLSTSRRTNLKPLHWVKVTRAMQGSLWAEWLKSDEASKAPEFDLLELETLFSASVPNADSGSRGISTRRASLGSKSDKIHLIDLRRANNCEIMLTKVKIPLPDLTRSLLTLDDSVLDVDQLENLIKFSPTKEEMDLLKAYSGDKESLGKCEQFFLELMKVPRVGSKLRVFSFKIQFQFQVSDLRRSLNIINYSAQEIRNSFKLKRIMQTILSLGNALNQGTARGSAIGFKLDSILKLTDTRAHNNKMTLMHYLCKVISDKLPELLDFPKDLVSLEVASKIQLKSLAEEMQAISKGLEKVCQELTASENDGPISEVFHKEFLVTAEAEVRDLTSMYSGVGRNTDALALYFGEDPTRCSFEQVVSTLLNFVRMFTRAHEENCMQIELGKKKAKKEAENERMKLNILKKGSKQVPHSPIQSENTK